MDNVTKIYRRESAIKWLDKLEIGTIVVVILNYEIRCACLFGGKDGDRYIFVDTYHNFELSEDYVMNGVGIGFTTDYTDEELCKVMEVVKELEGVE